MLYEIFRNNAKSKWFFLRVEKYRPNSLDDLVSHEDIIKTGTFADI